MRTLAELRATKRMSQADLAYWLGVTPSTVYNWERGRSEPRASQLKSMALFFGVAMEDVLLPYTEEHTKRPAPQQEPEGG